MNNGGVDKFKKETLYKGKGVEATLSPPQLLLIPLINKWRIPNTFISGQPEQTEQETIDVK